MAIISPKQLLETSRKNYAQVTDKLTDRINEALSKVILQPNQTLISIDIQKPVCSLTALEMRKLTKDLLIKAGYQVRGVDVDSTLHNMCIDLTIPPQGE